jgi:hypothetical protein
MLTRDHTITRTRNQDTKSNEKVAAVLIMLAAPCAAQTTVPRQPMCRSDIARLRRQRWRPREAIDGVQHPARRDDVVAAGKGHQRHSPMKIVVAQDYVRVLYHERVLRCFATLKDISAQSSVQYQIDVLVLTGPTKRQSGQAYYSGWA